MKGRTHVTAPAFIEKVKGAAWYPVWRVLWLTAAGLFLGLLALPIGADSLSEVSGLELLEGCLSSPTLLALNLLPVVLLLWAAYCLTGRGWAAYIIAAIPTLAIPLVSYFKIQLRGDPFVAEDLKLVFEAGNMAGKYSLEVTPLICLDLALALVGLAVVCVVLPRKKGGVRERLFGLLSALALLWVAMPALYLDEELYENTNPDGEWFNPWSDSHAYISHGAVYSFLFSMSDILPQSMPGPAAGGEGQRTPEEILSAYPEADIPQNEKVNVVGIMLEAFCDLTDFPALAEQPGVQQVYDSWHRLEEQSVSGNLLTNIFAGGTVDSEWAFLTGYSQHSDFVQPTDSYVWYFDRQGYNTRGGHPGFGWFYDRENVNRYLGFQEYWFTENHYGQLVDPVAAQWHSDDILVGEIYQDLVDQIGQGAGPVFSFSVSYQNHGPYEYDHMSYEAIIDPAESGLPAESCYVFSNYLHGVNETIQAMVGLSQRLEELEEPTVLVLFGDHKPWGGNGNSGYLGINANFNTSTLEGFYQYYSTPYLIWANSAAKEVLDNAFVGDGGDFSPCFLMTEVFNQCGWTGPSFLQLSRDMREVTPLLHSMGIYMDEEGNLTDTLDEADSAFLADFLLAQAYREENLIPQGE